ncbi:MAG: hypothetical protein C4524_03245 [Candidatus Zixiibacteriota bacterium]|nr:MAG: hypothetical protein C4524_03245 [candidate division Zixibacteria bacterium]
MRELIRAISQRPWPKLEIPAMGRKQYWGLVLYVAAIIGAGWYIWFTGIAAEKFMFLGLAIPVLFLLRSRYFFLVSLLAFEVVMAFLYVGNEYFVRNLLIVFVACIIAFESPMLIYGFLVVWLWFEMSAWGGFIINPTRLEFVISAGFFVGWFLKEVMQSHAVRTKVKTVEIKPAVILLLWITIGFLGWCLERYPAGWAQYKFILLGFVLLLVSPMVINNYKKLYWAVWAWIVSGAISALTAIYSQATGFQVGSAGEGGPSWGSYNAALGIQHSWSASYLNLTFFVTLAAAYWVKDRFLKFFLVISAILTFIGIWYQYSKGVTVGTILGLVIFWLLQLFTERKERRELNFMTRILVLILIGATAGAGIFIVGVDVGNYNALVSQSADITIQGRVFLWSVAYEMAVSQGHLIRGLGPGAYWVLAYDYGLVYSAVDSRTGETVTTQSSMDYSFHGVNPHNIYVDTALHYGILGLILFLWLIIANLFRLFRGAVSFPDRKFRYLYLGLFAALVSFYFSGIFDFNFFIISRYWLFLGLAIAALRVGQVELTNMANSTGENSLLNER